MTIFHLPSIPADLRWDIAPKDWRITDDQMLTITAGPRTDLFTNPHGKPPMQNTPRAVFAPQGDFLLSATVDVDFQATFDAGVLVLYQDKDRWAKLCFEYSPQRQPMVVSVVTRGMSDDCNSAIIDGRQVYLRIARFGKAWGFHYSTDGRWWHLVRHFTLGDLPDLVVGFSAQSPTGEGCTVTFTDIRYTLETLADIRSGA